MIKERSSILSRLFSSRMKSTKPTMSIELFCEALYENFVFFSTDDDIEDKYKIFCSEIFDSIVKTDDAFKDVDFEIFTNEMTALHAELFGLAWMHHFRLEKYNGLEEKYTFGEIVFTKNYMERYGYANIWNTMSCYNKAIADALLHPCIKAVDRDFWPIIKVKDVIPHHVIHRNLAKKELRNKIIDSWKIELGLDCATRIVNRMSNREDWGGCPMSILLTKTFAERMDWKIDLIDIRFTGFEELINRLYNDFKQIIEAIEIKY